MDFDNDMKEALNLFVIESRELLQEMEDGLLGLEQNESPGETVNAIFRTAHTIKG